MFYLGVAEHAGRQQVRRLVEKRNSSRAPRWICCIRLGRNSIWLWCGCLAVGRDETCYTGNSHIRPLLQVIDDGGDFRGWVGVEPFANQSTTPPDYADNYWIVFEFTDSVPEPSR